MRSSDRGSEPALERALGAVGALKAGSWESVETLALVAIAAHGRPEASSLLSAARQAAAGLKAGSWESARALAWLARAEQGTDSV